MTRRRDRQRKWDQERQEAQPNRRTVPQKKQIVQITPRTTNQKLYLKQLQSERIDIVFGIGAAGVGKTYLPCLLAVKMLKENLIDKVIVTRPAVSVDEDHGFLPGPQPLDAKILTPTGWTTMGALSVGDFVIGRDGKPTEVLGIYPKGKKLVYKVTTTDGTSTEACGDHLWHTRTLNDQVGGVKTTLEIMDTLVDGDKFNHVLPRNEAVHFNSTSLSMPPCALGALLVDGSLDELTIDGVTGDRHIPDAYKFSSIDDRIELLRGLMDAGGTVKSGEAYFCTDSERLATDVMELVRSLGGSAMSCEVDETTDRPVQFAIRLSTSMNPFTAQHNTMMWPQVYIPEPIIKSIEPVCEKEVQCILVDNPEHLYITDEYIVTHNTLEQKMAPWVRPIFDVFSQYYYAREIENMIREGVIEIAPLSYMRGRSFERCFIIADEIQNATVSQVKMLLTRIGEGSKMVVTGDLNQHDRGFENNGLSDFVDRLRDSGSKRISVIEFGTEDIQRHPVVAEVLRLYGED